MIPSPSPVPPQRPHSPSRGGTVLLVIAVVAVGFLVASSISFWFLFMPGAVNPGGPGSTPIGTAFDPGNPTVGPCSSTDSFSADGCQGADHFAYRIAILGSALAIGDVWFAVHTSTGGAAIVPDGLGFSILTENGALAAQYAVSAGEMSMSSGWGYASGVNASTALTTAYTIVIDMGTMDPSGQQLSFVALGIGTYSGTTSSLALP
jgi:hypothetical protein